MIITAIHIPFLERKMKGADLNAKVEVPEGGIPLNITKRKAGGYWLWVAIPEEKEEQTVTNETTGEMFDLEQAAKDRGITAYDTSLPQDFFDKASAVADINPLSHIVWCYDKVTVSRYVEGFGDRSRVLSNLFGYPVAVLAATKP